MEGLITILVIVGVSAYCGYKKGLGKADMFNGVRKKYEEIFEENKKLNTKNQNLNQRNQELITSIDKFAREEKEILYVKDNLNQVKQKISKLSKIEKDISKNEIKLKELINKADLYSRIDELIGYGHFETPNYLYEMSQSFVEAIKINRNKQKKMITDKVAIEYAENNIITNFTSLNNQIFKNTSKLMIKTYNIECDFLIEKVTPSNFSKTLEKIWGLATEIEKISPTLEIVFNDKYIELKMQECELVYQYKLKKQEEKEEQILIRERMNEEKRANAEYQKAIDDAKKEEEIYEKLLNKVKLELEYATSEEKALKEKQIEELEAKLKEAEANSQRAISLAQQTKRGYIYIISNIGSFGENVYKIGMTRRLEPMDRIDELGDASVPFKFDVHAIIYCEDAPNVEYQLHKYFANSRVNAVNFRKEFFKVSLQEIKQALDEIIKDEYEFKTTILAEEYFESLRLRKNS
ncbi:hypothetical protein CR66_04875 [Campylobacter mucosalis]|uniref:DUF4041 domain-containing protein n=1 Tax=Campylobacter mucosalis TaxID=202 RepID=UPI0004D9692F|nr:DUF4041 domain-containing protein [Campylobacter mucosalis]KEA46096.1 hypothetical protein CR66_04875 [Campylobacter mucosalis]QKF63477.1 putative helicase (T5orf172 domain) [Campylobacter mucosalis]